MCASIISPQLNACLARDGAQQHAAIIARVRERYQELGLVRKQAKAKEQLRSTEVWGGMLSSDRQSIAADPSRRQLVMDALAAAVQCSAMLPDHMELLVGHASYCLLFKRCLLCLLSHVYHWLATHKNKKVAIPLPAKVRDELISTMLLLPVAETSLTASLMSTVLATDATTSWGGVCHAPLEESEAVLMWSRRRPKHCRMIYCHENPHQVLQAQGESLPRDPILHDLVSSLQFKESLRYKFKREGHINLLEGHAWLSGIK
eukprot:6352459-Amphidinium_carterae.1